MSAAFIHLSDIHFGQEKGGSVVIHADVRERLIDDVAMLVRDLPGGRVAGIIVSGDIAFAGQLKEYGEAGQWLDRLASAAGCKITDIQVVPGNHDINRSNMCRSSEMMLGEISEKGETQLDYFLELERDRELFYDRFDGYREFAEGYDCPLDVSGGNASERSLMVAPGRVLRFVGLNSALCCAKNDEKGKLLLGARQRVLPRNAGEELVVICHHPLPWLRDSEEARQYVRSRARVFISGHEHTPQIEVDRIEEGSDLLMIAAGATVPPVADGEFTFTYNLIEFSWNSETDGLTVTIHPRVWSQSHTAFEANAKQFGADKVSNGLGCPNFRNGLAVPAFDSPDLALIGDGNIASSETVRNDAVDAGPQEARNDMEDKFPFLLLRFFRDLSATQRLRILVQLGALPKNWNGTLTHPMERRAIDSLRSVGKLDALEQEIEKSLSEPSAGVHE